MIINEEMRDEEYFYGDEYFYGSKNFEMIANDKKKYDFKTGKSKRIFSGIFGIDGKPVETEEWFDDDSYYATPEKTENKEERKPFEPKTFDKQEFIKACVSINLPETVRKNAKMCFKESPFAIRKAKKLVVDEKRSLVYGFLIKDADYATLLNLFNCAEKACKVICDGWNDFWFGKSKNGVLTDKIVSCKENAILNKVMGTKIR